MPVVQGVAHARYGRFHGRLFAAQDNGKRTKRVIGHEKTKAWRSHSQTNQTNITPAMVLRKQRNRGRATCVDFCDWTEKQAVATIA